MSSVVERYPNLRVAADLAATAVYNSPAVPIRGRRSVTFFATSSAANQLSASAIQVSQDGTTWMPVANDATLIVSNQLHAVALNAGPRQMSMNHNYAIGLHWEFARVTVTGHATLTVSNLAIQATTMRDTDPVTSDFPNVTG